MAGILYKQRWIERSDLQANPTRIYVFGDNMQRAGYGGQAKAMRDEPNAIGVPTKWSPSMSPKAFFAEADWRSSDVRTAIIEAFRSIREAMASGLDIVIPADGLGTGLAELPTRAPVIHAFIEQQMKQLEYLASEVRDNS